jgi:hypothetical protein
MPPNPSLSRLHPDLHHLARVELGDRAEERGPDQAGAQQGGFREGGFLVFD